jgi:hypothetical protein
MKTQTKRERYNTLKVQLKSERSSFDAHWQDLAEHIFPRRTRFHTQDTNQGKKVNGKIIDNTPTIAARTLRSGMMSGVTSPARQWFRLATPDPSMMDLAAVKNWLYVVGQRMSTIFLKSNLYQTLPTTYGDMGVFATGCLFMEEDFDQVVRFYSFPTGSYMIGNDSKNRVNLFMREFRLTVRQMVEKFAIRDSKGEILTWENFSERVKNLYDDNKLEAWVDITHVIEPNVEYSAVKPLAKFKKFASTYYETGRCEGSSKGDYTKNSMSSDGDKYLRESGYDFFPVLCPRWEVTGEDVYGTNSPGMEALGDIKQLMLGEKRTMQAVEKMINPPMTGPVSMMNSKSSILPGDMSYVDVREGTQGFRPAHEVQFQIQPMEMKQGQVRARINETFYKDLFLMMAESDRREITATEINERREEKLLALGPVLEQLNQDLLDPLIDNTFDIMLRQNMIPRPPDELHGVPLRVEYISVMAQAQKYVGISAVERFAGFSSNVIAANPSVADKINMDELINVYADLTSVPPGIVRSDDEANAMRSQRSQAQAAQNKIAMLQQGAGAAKDLSQADMGGDNALTRLISNANAGSLLPQQ